MSMHGIRPTGLAGLPEQSSRNRGISFDWPAPCQILSRSNKKCARYPLWKKFAPRKSRPKFTLGHQICHQSIGRTKVSIDTGVSLALDCFVSQRYCWYCIANATFLHIPLLFHHKLRDVSPELDRR